MEKETLFSLLFQFSIVTHYVMGFTSGHEKRMLLHDDQDALAIITTLQAKVAVLETEVSKVSALETEVAKLKSNILSAPLNSGSVYVRWGKTSCPGNGTELIYNGLMAGNKWNDHGGGSNSVCLPNDPTWGRYTDGLNTVGAMYGTEIEVPDTVANNLFGKTVTNEDLTCSVCRTVRPSSVMISGRANCYPGWTMEYKGYVVSGGSTWNNNVDYVCLDADLEFAPHGAANDNEHVLNVVEVHCGAAGSIPCPPYVNGRELACVVCSK